METLKSRGNEAFKLGNYSAAISLYTDALKNTNECTELCRYHCFLNRTLSWLKLGQFSHALVDSEAALSLQPSSVKALYRRALALNGVGSRDKAFRVLIDLCKMDPAHVNLYKPLINSISQFDKDPSRLASSIISSSDCNIIECDLKKISVLLSTETIKADKLASNVPFLSFLLQNASKDLDANLPSTHENAVTNLSLSVLVQIIRLKGTAAFFVEPQTIWTLVQRSKYSARWLALLSAVAETTTQFEVIKSAVAVLHHGLTQEFSRHQSSQFDANCCNRILFTLGNIAMSSTEHLKQVRSGMLLSILKAPKLVRDQVDLLKIISILSECKTDGNLSAESDSDVPKLAVPSPDFVDMAQNIVSDFFKNIETIGYGLNALFLILTAIPSASSSLIAESDRLTTLLELASSSNEMGGDATAVLALASSDMSVCSAISEADYSYLFFVALDSEEPLVAVFACLALSKLSMINLSVQSEILKANFVFEKLCSLMNNRTKRIPNIALEAFLYLSVFCETKIAVVHSGLLTSFLASIPHLKNDPSARFAIAQIIASFSTSSEDLKLDAELDSERAKLKEVASKGIPGQKTTLDLSSVAGNATEIDNIKLGLLENGIGCVLSDLIHAFPSTSRSQRLDGAVAKAFVRLSAIPSHCSRLVAQGALAALLKIVQHSEIPRPASVQYDAKLSIMRFCIRTNPELLGSRAQSALPNICLNFIERAKHELHEYEALLALTNIASLNEEIRNQIMGLKGWQRLLSCLSSSNELIQAAALEAMVNLLTNRSAINRLSKQDSAAEQDIKILLMFARSSQNERMISAALAGLAIISIENRIAKMILSLGGSDVASDALRLFEDENIRIRASTLLKNLQELNRK